MYGIIWYDIQYMTLSYNIYVWHTQTNVCLGDNRTAMLYLFVWPYNMIVCSIQYYVLHTKYNASHTNVIVCTIHFKVWSVIFYSCIVMRPRIVSGVRLYGIHKLARQIYADVCHTILYVWPYNKKVATIHFIVCNTLYITQLVPHFVACIWHAPWTELYAIHKKARHTYPYVCHNVVIH